MKLPVVLLRRSSFESERLKTILRLDALTERNTILMQEVSRLRLDISRLRRQLDYQKSQGGQAGSNSSAASGSSQEHSEGSNVASGTS